MNATTTRDHPKSAPVEFLTGPDVRARYRKSHVTI